MAPALPDWQVLVFEERAFWATAKSRLELLPIAEEEDLWELNISSSVVGNSEELSLDFEPNSGRMQKRMRLSKGKEQRLKSFEYQPDAIIRERRNPGSDPKTPPAEWPLASRISIDYPDSVDKLVVTNPHLLILLAQRLLAQGPGASREVLVHTDRNFYRVRMTSGNGIPIDARYGIVGQDSFSGRRDTMAVALQASPEAHWRRKKISACWGCRGDHPVLRQGHWTAAAGPWHSASHRRHRHQPQVGDHEKRRTVIEPRGPVGVISNPGSGHNRNQFDAIRERLARCEPIHHIVTESPADIGPALANLAERGVQLLAINGGDGTASAVLGQMLEEKTFPTPPRIALLPGGTANMNAGDIGVRGSLVKAVERFCRWCDNEHSSGQRLEQRALLRVTRDDSTEPEYGMFLGGGAVIQGTEYAHEEVHSRGMRDDFSLALSTARTVWGVLRDDPRFNRHVTLSLSLDGSSPTTYDTLILAISTLERLAFGMRPFWADEPGAIRLTLMEQGCSRFARTFLSIVRGRPNRNAVPASGYRSHNTQSIALGMTGKLNLDGEILDIEHSVEIRASQSLEFLVL